MAKLTLTDLGTTARVGAQTTAINNNNAAIETALENTLSRDGTTPNQMLADLDMNSNQILNLPTPVNPTDVVRLSDMDTAIENLADTLFPVLDGNYGDVTISGNGSVITINANAIDANKLASSSVGSAAIAAGAVANSELAVNSVSTDRIQNDAVTNAKLANVATATFKGRTTAGTGDVEDLSATQATALLNTFTTTLKGLVPASGGGTSNFLRADGTFAVPAGGGNALTSNPLSQFAATTSAQLAGVMSDETGSGALVFGTSPTLVTPILGTPASGTLTNCTGLPIAGITGLGTGMATLLANGIEEQGSWTPTVTFTTPGDVTVSYVTQLGTYYRIGKLVFIYLWVKFTPTYTTAAGSFTITGAPFTTADANAGGPLVSHLATLDYPAGRAFPMIYFATSSALRMIAFGTGAAASAFTVTQVASAEEHQIIASFCYRTA